MVSLFTKLIDFFLVICIITGSAMTGGANDNDISVIEKNITDGILEGKLGTFSSSDILDAEGIIAKTAADDDGNFYFTDVDYKNNDRSNWLPSRHIARTERLTVLYRLEKDEAKKARYRKYVFGLLDHWIKKDYQCSNWWYNQLSVPNALGETALLLKSELSGDRLLKLAELVSRGSFTVNLTARARTGANITDVAMSTIKFGVLVNSPNSIKTAVRLVSRELEYSDNEGLRADGTFFQHGRRIYMGGYGIEFISGISELTYILSGTKYNFSTEQLTRLSHFVLDGLQTMSFGSTLDPTTMGRSVTRKNAQPLRSVISPLKKLAQVEEMPRKDEILSYISSIENDTKTNKGLKYFDEAKFLVINNDNFYFSFRGGSNELAYSEIINDENFLAYNSSFPGVTTIMHNGNEYVNIAPVFDYSLVPGTTAVYETDEQLKAHSDFTYRYLKGTYGSKTAQGAAVSFAKTVHEGINMTITCFATDNAAFLLGAGMTDNAGREMITTLDQSRYCGSFTREGNTVVHNSIKYTLLEGGELSAKEKHVTGSWGRNNIMYGTEPVEDDVFTITVKNNGSYAYSVMADTTDESIEIISNTEKIQAVKLPDGRIAAAFFESGSFDYNGRTYNGKAGEAYIY